MNRWRENEEKRVSRLTGFRDRNGESQNTGDLRSRCIRKVYLCSRIVPSSRFWKGKSTRNRSLHYLKPLFSGAKRTSRSKSDSLSPCGSWTGKFGEGYSRLAGRYGYLDDWWTLEPSEVLSGSKPFLIVEGMSVGGTLWQNHLLLYGRRNGIGEAPSSRYDYEKSRCFLYTS